MKENYEKKEEENYEQKKENMRKRKKYPHVIHTSDSL